MRTMIRMACLPVFCMACIAQAQQSGPVSAQARLLDTTGRLQGTATFQESARGLEITVDTGGLRRGRHAMHVHEHGECAPGPDATEQRIVPFGAAGGHFDPGHTHDHGAPDETAVHAGDLPNVDAARDGRASLRTVASRLSLAPGKQSIMGRALVIHERPDDYRSDPAGNSGDRVLCGIVEPAEGAVTGRYLLPGSNTFPEGIAYDEAGQTLYFGSAAEGHLYRLRIQEAKAERFALGGSPGRQSALGMKIDGLKRLWIAGQSSGMISVVDTRDGMVSAVLRTPKDAQAFINDLVIAPDGQVYITDSARPVIFRASSREGRPQGVEAWLDLAGTPIRYADGVNLNGIVVTADGRHLLAVQSNTGQLWRIDIASRQVQEVRLDAALTGGDGLLLEGRRLYVARNAANEIAVLDLAMDMASGRVVQRIHDPRLKFPTTLVRVGQELVVVNGQLDKRKAPPPLLPFDAVRLRVTSPLIATP